LRLFFSMDMTSTASEEGRYLVYEMLWRKVEINGRCGPAGPAKRSGVVEKVVRDIFDGHWTYLEDLQTRRSLDHRALYGCSFGFPAEPRSYPLSALPDLYLKPLSVLLIGDCSHTT